MDNQPELTRLAIAVERMSIDVTNVKRDLTEMKMEFKTFGNGDRGLYTLDSRVTLLSREVGDIRLKIEANEKAIQEEKLSNLTFRRQIWLTVIGAMLAMVGSGLIVVWQESRLAAKRDTQIQRPSPSPSSQALTDSLATF